MEKWVPGHIQAYKASSEPAYESPEKLSCLLVQAVNFNKTAGKKGKIDVLEHNGSNIKVEKMCEGPFSHEAALIIC